MNKQTQKSDRIIKYLLQPLFFVAATTMTIYSMETPRKNSEEPPLAIIARFGKASDLQQYLDTNTKLNPTTRLPDGNTALHAISYPVSITAHHCPSTSELYQKKLHAIARSHAYKADLLLRKFDSRTLLIQHNNKKQTPTVLAAQYGYLPVMARLMLSNPSDWAYAISDLTDLNKTIIISSFLCINKIQNSPTKPTALKPAIRADLHVILPQDKMVELINWAQDKPITTGNPEGIQKHNWAHLNREQIKYMFECYLLLDIQLQYEENPKHPIVKAYFESLLIHDKKN